MKTRLNRKAVWGWMLFDWAAQPFHTLIITFIFAPYFAAHVVGDATRGQAIWGYGMAATGFAIAVLAPVFGALADTKGGRRRWLMLFSVIYFVGACTLWWAMPGAQNLWPILLAFGISLAAIEFSATFVNAYLPEIAPRDMLGQLSGSGWGLGYVGGLLALILVLVLVAEGPNGTTLIGISPVGGLDPATFEGTRSVGPISAIWYAVFVIPFLLWVPERQIPASGSTRSALGDLGRTLRKLPERKSFMSYLASSMFFRDALNGVFAFGGIYAIGVLEWSTIQIGTFGIAAATSGAIGAWFGGRCDRAVGPYPVLVVSILLLIIACLLAVGTQRSSVLGFEVSATSGLPDIAFLICGMMFGAAGGSLQSAGRTALVQQADPARLTEAFGLYAFAGRATAFIAPLAIAITTDLTGSQRAGILPVIALLVIALLLLALVRNKPDEEADLVPT